MDSQNFFKEKQLSSFFFLSFLFSWVIWIPFVIFYLENPTLQSSLSFQILIVVFIGACGPSFAAILLSGIENGKLGIIELLSRWKIWKVGIQWYLVVILIPLTTRALAIIIYVLFTGKNPQIKFNVFFLVIFLLAIIGGPLAEETGWRGYFLPKLMKNQSALTSSIIIGIIWSFWHIPMFFLPGIAIPGAIDVFVLIQYVLKLTSIAVLFTWVYINTKGSIFLAFLFHNIFNSSGNFLSLIIDFEMTIERVVFVDWLIVAQQCLIVIIIIALGAFSKKSAKEEHLLKNL